MLRMPKSIPSTEEERTAEALFLIGKLSDADEEQLTVWEVELVESLRQGYASTRIRLKELREAVHRIKPELPYIV
jgi:hypothetical protein